MKSVNKMKDAAAGNKKLPENEPGSFTINKAVLFIDQFFSLLLSFPSYLSFLLIILLSLFHHIDY